MLKRGTKIEYTYAFGRKVQGTIVKPQPINFHAKHGVDLWYVVKLVDEDGEYSGSVHYGQVRNIDNRPSYAKAA
jgi:hypothetical protein